VVEVKVKLFYGLLFALLSVVLVAGSGLAAGMETFVMGLPGDARSLDPHKAADTMSFTVIRHINEPLVTVDGKSRRLVPVLAERWEMIDPQTYKFYLKKGVKFHNGNDFTAEDVVFSLKRAASPESMHAGSRGKFIDPEGFEIIDDHTVIVKTRGPIGGWLETMKHPYANIFSKKSVEEAGEEYFRNPVGTGPFKFKNWIRGERIELASFDGYHGKKPNFENLTFMVLPDTSSRVIALETGKVDMIYGVPSSDQERLKNSPDVQIVEATGLRLMYLGMNMEKKPLDDIRVRQAIEYAINKEAYSAVVYQRNAVIAKGPLPGASTFSPEVKKHHSVDLEKAKALLAEAGYPNGMTLELWTSNFQDRVDGATIIQAMLSQIGIQANIQVFEAGAFNTRMNGNEHDLFIGQWGMQTSRDAGTFWTSLFYSGGIGATNWGRLRDSEIDALIEKAQLTVNDAERSEWLQKIWDRLNEMTPMVPIVVPDEIYATRKNLEGVKDLADGQINYLGDLLLKK
jgi:peptide/nickel transport system substrate-binding protein